MFPGSSLGFLGKKHDGIIIGSLGVEQVLCAAH